MSTTSRMISGHELNPLNGLGGLALDFRPIAPSYQLCILTATQI